jgi:hypothetical protein
MIYVLLGMHREEARNAHKETTPAFPMEITTLKDDWKQ